MASGRSHVSPIVAPQRLPQALIPRLAATELRLRRGEGLVEAVRWSVGKIDKGRTDEDDSNPHNCPAGRKSSDYDGARD